MLLLLTLFILETWAWDPGKGGLSQKASSAALTPVCPNPKINGAIHRYLTSTNADELSDLKVK